MLFITICGFIHNSISLLLIILFVEFMLYSLFDKTSFASIQNKTSICSLSGAKICFWLSTIYPGNVLAA
jgi:hypothetical protein